MAKKQRVYPPKSIEEQIKGVREFLRQSEKDLAEAQRYRAKLVANPPEPGEHVEVDLTEIDKVIANRTADVMMAIDKLNKLEAPAALVEEPAPAVIPARIVGALLLSLLAFPALAQTSSAPTRMFGDPPPPAPGQGWQGTGQQFGPFYVEDWRGPRGQRMSCTTQQFGPFTSTDCR